MSEWVETTLGEVAEINPESVPQTWSESREIRYVDLTSVTRERGIDQASLKSMEMGSAPGRARRIVRKGDVLVSTVRPNLRAFAVVPPALDGEVASTGFAVIRSKQDTVVPGLTWCVVTSDAFVDDMITRCTGSNYPAIRGSDVAAYRFALPPLAEQRRIVAVICSLDEEIAALENESAALNLTYSNALSLLWTDGSGDQAALRRLADLMTLDIERVKVAAEGKYPIAGVMNAGKGLISRGVMMGTDTDYSTLNRLRAGQVVMRKLTAWEGPISLVPDEFNNHFASSEFPTFSLQPGLSARYFAHVCRSQRLLDEMKNRVTGTVQRRKRLNPEQLLEVQLPIPTVSRQELLAGVLDSMCAASVLLNEELAGLRRVRADLLSALLSQEITVDEALDQLIEPAA